MKNKILWIIILIVLASLIFVGYLFKKSFLIEDKTVKETEQEEVLDTQKELRNLAEKWIIYNSPTFKFDGKNLEFKQSTLLSASSYEFVFSFDSYREGYGNEKAEALEEKLVSHTIIIISENREVISAITDEKYDEINGKKISEDSASLANPASVYCEESEGILDMRTGPAGEKGFCTFDDFSECEEWAYFRGECAKGDKYCKDLCGDGECQEMVCMATNCPCAETKESCAEDCD